MAIIKLKSSDNKIFEVDDNIARMSVKIKTMLDGLGVQEKYSEPIPIQDVPAAILELVIMWANHHKDDSPPPPNKQNEDREAEVIIVSISISIWFKNKNLIRFYLDLGRH